MTPEHTRYLWETFPRLYAGRDRPMTESLIPFGFECGDGWFDIIKRLSEKLEPLGAVAVQVKEKYGELAFYAMGSDEAFDLIDAAEEESARTCENCGARGSLRGKVWVTTLCDACALELELSGMQR